jgi:D-serine deaminase-like pyridoxal phosphate-dependent protein|tara:strand:+ start:689 stop:1786 length:1098 start_codon:yes stop_codon:yes gene_type:complete
MVSTNYPKGTKISEIDTPSIVVDLDIAESNISKMQNFANENKVSMRPHTKTTKSPFWAKKQIEAGAIGICCAKLGEAEVMAQGGIPEILIPNQIVGKEKIERLVKVNKISKVMVAVENIKNVKDLSDAFLKESQILSVIIELNVGMDRCGVELDEIVDFAKNIKNSKGLSFEGIMGYEGHTVNIGNYEDRVNETTKAMNKLIAAKDLLVDNDIPVKIVSASGTGTYNITSKIKGITELECGSYIFMDGNYLKIFDDFQPALSLMCTVVSRRGNRLIIDCGLKSVSMDQGLPQVVSPKGIILKSLSEEHCTCIIEDGIDIDLNVGDKVFVRPMHSDTTINLHEDYFVYREDKLETIVPILGRGKFK